MTEGTRTRAEIMRDVKRLAKEYRVVTGRTLGCMGEIEEYEACRLLAMNLADKQQAGFDAVRPGVVSERVQIKTRVVGGKGQRVPGIDCSKDRDGTVLVLLDANMDAQAIYEAKRETVLATLPESGPRVCKMHVSTFKKLAVQVWPPE